jgi:hypothetical protein
MNTTRKVVLSVVSMFAMSLALGLLGRALFLQANGDVAASLAGALVQQLPYVRYLVLAHLVIAIGFVWVYLRQREEGSFLGQGLRYGAVVAAFMLVPIVLVHHAVQPVQTWLVATHALCEGVGVTLMGVVVAWLNA